jgi:hypothetical protein
MKVHFGYVVAAIGYMIGIFSLSTSPEQIGTTGLAAPLFSALLQVPLFAGLASCLVLSVSDGQWYRRISWRLYGVIILIAGAYAGFAEWYQCQVSSRYQTPADLLLNLVGVAALLVVHRLAGGQRPGV